MKDATEVQTFPVVATAERAVCIALALLCYSAVVWTWHLMRTRVTRQPIQCGEAKIGS